VSDGDGVAREKSLQIFTGERHCADRTIPVRHLTIPHLTPLPIASSNSLCYPEQ
jgi:hypothetical protein